ncbi:hypothetical protein B0H13DRAFT_1507122, partial [Mycena leptocephala]
TAAAISMTLCEISTGARDAIPLECIESSYNIQGECVDALARSQQFWTSYSGYLRDARK